MPDRTTIGVFGPWAADLCKGRLPLLSLRRRESESLEAWRRKAVAKTLDLLSVPPCKISHARALRRFEYDGLLFQEVSWQLPYGPRTEAIFIKPAGARGRLPAVLALHDHGGLKYFGYRKIVRTGARRHPVIAAHQKQAYESTAWANEIARRGYAVLAHDTFAFGSRRVRYRDVIPELAGNRKESDRPRDIQEYNRFAGQHESVMAKSLFSAGTTWPGVVFAEDRCALDYLLSRVDVDRSRAGCCGLSGGGLRTVYLAGLDRRIKAAVCVGFMSTWRDFLLHKSWTHTWMTYAPLLPRYLDFPEILGLRAPLATMAQSCTQDPLYTVPEMKKADRVLKEVFRKAGAPSNYRCKFYPGGHKFDRAMQKDAFAFLDASLGTQAPVIAGIQENAPAPV